MRYKGRCAIAGEDVHTKKLKNSGFVKILIKLSNFAKIFNVVYKYFRMNKQVADAKVFGIQSFCKVILMYTKIIFLLTMSKLCRILLQFLRMRKIAVLYIETME